jgi:hypothetical protein
MSGHQIQFTSEDVIARLTELAALKLESPRCVLQHALVSPVVHIATKSQIISTDIRPDYVLGTLEQRDYAATIHDTSMKILKTTSSFMHEVLSAEHTEKKIQDMSAGYVTLLGILTKNVEQLSHAQKIEFISSGARQELSKISADLGVLLYTANRIFSPDFRRDTYYLAEDLAAFVLEIDGPLQDFGIHFGVQQTHKILTLDDYVANAVAPLVWNAKEHAFNPENDLYNRLEAEDMYKSVSVWVLLDEAKTSPCEFDVVVRDEGFGIRPEVQERLFERGTTTKVDTSTEHGIGLWGVKQFIEKYGGKIWVAKTELGRGTEFWFTIPYSHMDSFVYVQG